MQDQKEDHYPPGPYCGAHFLEARGPLGAVKRLFYGRGNGSDLGSQLLLYAIEVEAVVIGD